MSLHIAPQLSRHVFEFSHCTRGSPPSAFGSWIGLSVLFRLRYPAFLEALGGVLDDVPTRTPLFYWGTSTPTWAATALPAGPNGRPRTRWSDYVIQLAWERLAILPEGLEEVFGEREVWVSLLRQLPPQPSPG